MKVFKCLLLVLLFVIILFGFERKTSSTEELSIPDEEEESDVLSSAGVKMQALATTSCYIVFKFISMYNSDIYHDMESISWDINNSDINKVLNDKYVSFYRYAPVIKYKTNRAGTFLCLFLSSYGEDEETVKHEYGHINQQLILGPITYLVFIGIPSYFELSDKEYYYRPWEITADIFGGVTKLERMEEGFSERDIKDLVLGTFYLVTGALLSRAIQETINKE